MGFEEKVYKATKRVPRGKVTTYKEIARAIGNPWAVRAVGNALNKNVSKEVPCHRVVKSDGGIGCYNKGSKKKKELLESEGTRVKKGKLCLRKYQHPLTST